MGLFDWFSGLFSDDSVSFTGDNMMDANNNSFENDSLNSMDSSWDDNAINPANGLPMVGGTGGVDVEGNPFGTDFSHDDTISSGMDDAFSSGIDDSFSSGIDDTFSTGMDDSFSSGGGFDDW